MKTKRAMNFAISVMCICIVCVLTGCPKRKFAPLPENVRIEYSRSMDGNIGHLAIWQGEKRVFFKDTGGCSCGFMKPEKKGSHSTIYTEAVNGDDYRKYLLDLKGDGDYRHLIVNLYQGGTNPYNHEAWVLDVKDGFICLGKVDGGEGIIYPEKNPDLIFTLQAQISLFSGGLYAVACQDVMLNREGRTIYVLKKEEPKPLKHYRDTMYDRDYSDRESTQTLREYTLYTLCADLAQCGHLREFRKIAAELGYTDQELSTTEQEAISAVTKCRFWPAYCRVNGLTEKERKLYESSVYMKNSVR